MVRIRQQEMNSVGVPELPKIARGCSKSIERLLHLFRISIETHASRTQVIITEVRRVGGMVYRGCVLRCVAARDT